ncbi:MAG: Wzz/FepE/Etk N-terminal domain-containing protein [Rhizorhabdus sp.]
MNQEIDVLRHSVHGGARMLLADPPPVSRTPPDRIDLGWLVTTLRRRKRLFLAITLTIAAIALLLTLLQTPTYIATAQVVLNVSAEDYAPDTRRPNDKAFTQDAADTEIEVIRSQLITQSAADTILSLHPGAAAALVEPHRGPLARIRSVWSKPEPVAADAAEQRSELASVLRKNLNVQRNGSTYAVTIGYGAADPRAAAIAANAYASAYSGGQLSDKQEDNRGATQFLGRRIDELRAQANVDNERVQRFRIANNLLSTSGASLTEQEISSYNQRVADARTEAAGDQARLETAQAQLRAGSSGDDVGEALGSTVVSELRGKRAEVSARLATLTSRYGRLHPDVINATGELADVDKAISQEIGRVISNLEARARVSRDRLAAISGSLSGARGRLAQNNRAAVQLDDLERRAEASQQLYESYLNRYKETAAREGTERSDSRIVSLAEAPEKPASPNLPLNLMLGLILGAGLGLAGSLGAEMAFAGLTTGEDVESGLGQRFLGAIPLLDKRANASPRDLPLQPHTLTAQALRNLRTSLTYATGEGTQVIALTSALPREGKTVTSLGLARSIAADGASVVLLDCDFHQRGLSRMLAMSGEKPGLLEVLEGTAPLDAALVRDPASDAWLLPTFASESTPTATLTGPEMSNLLATLRERFRYVVLDMSPVLPVAETREMVAKADAVLFLVRWRRTADHAVRAALRLLPGEVVNLAGIALTAVDVGDGAGAGDASAYHRQYRGYLGPARVPTGRG